MCLLKKNAVIFKVGYDVKDPIVVIQQKMFTNEEPDSSVPLLGIYDGTHYQSVFPASKKDEKLTEDIVKYFPEFQGDFKAFFKDGLNSSYEEPASEEENSEIDELSSYKEADSEQENYEIGGPNSTFEGAALDQVNSEQENSEIDGLNSSYEEPASEEENSEIDELSSNYKETDSEQENSEIGGPNSTFEGAALDQVNSENKDDKHLKHKGILSDFEEEAMLFMTMQEKKNEKLKKRARQRIRAQVI